MIINIPSTVDIRIPPRSLRRNSFQLAAHYTLNITAPKLVRFSESSSRTCVRVFGGRRWLRCPFFRDVYRVSKLPPQGFLLQNLPVARPFTLPRLGSSGTVGAYWNRVRRTSARTAQRQNSEISSDLGGHASVLTETEFPLSAQI